VAGFIKNQTVVMDFNLFGLSTRKKSSGLNFLSMGSLVGGKIILNDLNYFSQ